MRLRAHYGTGKAYANKVYSNKLEKLIDIWVDMALTKNLSGKGTQKNQMIFSMYQYIELIRYSIVRQALLDGVIEEKDYTKEFLSSVEGQLSIVADITYQLRDDIYS